MRWDTLFLSAAAFWHSAADASAVERVVGLAARDTTQHPESNAEQQAQIGQYVYRADPRSPRQIRGLGGFQPSGPGWEQEDLAFDMERHFRIAPNGRGLHDYPQYRDTDLVYRTAYVSVVFNIETLLTFADVPGDPGWIFEIRATGNILDDNWPETECVALGGIHWYQIRRYRRNLPGAQWIPNPDYDTTWFENLSYEHAYRVSRVNPVYGDYDQTFPMDLTGRSDDSASDDDSMGDSDHTSTGMSGDESEWDGPGSTPQPRLGHLRDDARDWVNLRTQSRITSLLGDFPPAFRRYTATVDPNIPGPARTRTYGELKWMDRWVLASLQRYLDMGEEGMRVLVPDNEEMMRSVFNNINLARCSTWPVPSATQKFKRLFSRADVADVEAKLEQCSKLYSEIRTLLYKSAERKWSSKTKTQAVEAPKPKPAKVVFYADYLWPEEAKAQGGFFPVVTVPPSLMNELESGEDDQAAAKVGWEAFLVPAYTTFGKAAKHAADLAFHETKNFSGIVYAVHATPNIVNLGHTAAAVGGIQWSQVLAWQQIPEGYRPPPQKATDRSRDELEKTFAAAFSANKTLFTLNEDYNHAFDQYQTTVDIPQNMSVIGPGLVRFMNQYGKPVGWTGKFPLSAPRNITAEASRQAKANNAVAPPHDPGMLSSAWTYMENHPVAVALLPVVGLLLLVPGVGEVAGVTEATALTAGEAIATEQAESFAMTSASSGLATILRGVAKLKIA